MHTAMHSGQRSGHRLSNPAHTLSKVLVTRHAELQMQQSIGASSNARGPSAPWLRLAQHPHVHSDAALGNIYCLLGPFLPKPTTARMGERQSRRL